MFLHWAVLPLLLLLVSTTAGVHRDAPLSPIERDCSVKSPTKNCSTVFNFAYNTLIKPEKTIYKEDLRLYPTAFVFYTTNDDGLIVGSPYSNPFVGGITRANCGGFHTTKDCAFWFNQFQMVLEGNKDAAIAKVRTWTDMIVYVGSEHMVNYEYPDYAYNKKLLQLAKGEVKENINTNGPFVSSYTFVEMSADMDDRVFLYSPAESGNKNQHVAQADLNAWITHPGIYRYRLNKGTMNEIYYDPSLGNNKYLT